MEETKQEETQIGKIGMIDRAIEAAERLEAANRKQEELLMRQEELMAKQALGGYSEAGVHVEVKEPTSKDKALDFWKGSPVQKAIEQYG